MSSGVNSNGHFSLTSKHFSPITVFDPWHRRAVVFTLHRLGLLGLSILRADTPQMGVADIRPGMVGIGRTVFDGTQVEEFKVNILGVIENVIGTQRNLILARLEGGPLANTGVIAGMSGSPVYIDGKLIGAVSYSLGQFLERTDRRHHADRRDDRCHVAHAPRPRARASSVEFPLTRENLIAAFRKALNWNRPFADRADDARFRNRRAGRRGRRRSRDDAPADRHAARRCLASNRISRMRWAPRSAIRGSFRSAAARGLRPGEMPFDGPLKPGDAIGVTFVDGDLELGATGTVTHVDGDRVYAFGHPLYNLGPTDSR